MKNTGIIRELKHISKKIDKQQKVKYNEKQKQPKRTSYFLSFIAIIISLISIYLQFFYYNYDLTANLVDGDYKNDSLFYQIIYHNKGNQDATILSSKIQFYSKNSISQISFKQRETPLIISSRRQVYELMKFSTDFKNYNLKSLEVNEKDTISVELVFEFLNQNNHPAEKKINCGWIILDEKKKVKYYSTDLNSIILESDYYFTRAYRSEK